ncbi:MAG TPA: hypothetical protein VJK05_04000 [archaeon]|nr:hypothetical protein [archaeon]
MHSKGIKEILKKIKYPKLIFLAVTFIPAYLIFLNQDYQPFHNLLISLGYAGIFLAGFFYSYGFTSAPATALLLILAKQHELLPAVLAGGLGALVGDTVIFLFIRKIFAGEIKSLSKTKIIWSAEKEEEKILGKYHKYFLASFAGFIIASPFPTEIGIAMLASMKISFKKFAAIAFLLHSTGILALLLIGKAL